MGIFEHFEHLNYWTVLESNPDVFFNNVIVFFQKHHKKTKLKLAYIHTIGHRADIGLLEIFFLTYARPYDYHCIQTNPDLSGESLLILNSMVNCFNQFQSYHAEELKKNIFVANLNASVFWKLTSAQVNSELVCMRELLELNRTGSDWKYVVIQGRHSLPLISRIDLERHIVERIHGLSYFSDQLKKSHFIGAAFKSPIKDGTMYM